MFAGLMYMFVLIGIVMMMWNVIFPYMHLFPVVEVGFKIFGAVFIFIGIILYQGWAKKTTADQLITLADPMKTKCLHLGKSGARILTAKKMEPNRLRAKTKRGWMNIKDCGDAINLAGHDFVITSQDMGHNFPLWLVDAISKWKEKYGVRNEDEFKKLYDQIKSIKSYNDLDKIEFLKPILVDPEKKNKILDMKLDDFRNMRELLYDGRTIDIKAYLDWAEGATPYDNESIISSSVARIRAEDKSLQYGAMADWGKYIIPICILFIMGAIAYQIFA